MVGSSGIKNTWTTQPITSLLKQNNKIKIEIPNLEKSASSTVQV